jgi:hypothetical protein
VRRALFCAFHCASLVVAGAFVAGAFVAGAFVAGALVAGSLVAGALGATRLLMLTDVAGVLDKDKNLIAEMTLADVQAGIADGTITGGMIPKVENCVDAVRRALPMLIDRVMGEASLYEPDLAALALAQAGGDLYEAVLLLRAWRTTQPRLAIAEPVRQEQLFTHRRISAAFKAGLTDPVVFVSILLVQRLFAWLPAEHRD